MGGFNAVGAPNTVYHPLGLVTTPEKHIPDGDNGISLSKSMEPVDGIQTNIGFLEPMWMIQTCRQLPNNLAMLDLEPRQVEVHSWIWNLVVFESNAVKDEMHGLFASQEWNGSQSLPCIIFHNVIASDMD